jgi:pantoate--beta-alanine ligase
MGALHEGHLSLVELASQKASKTIVSLFVNPKQFGKDEDLDLYPRDEKGDLEKLARTPVDLVYTPDPAHMYPAGFSTTVSVNGVSQGLCGSSRPGHFDGVATIVTKLLLQCSAEFAVFGEKDYQQLMVIKRLTTDLDIPVNIIGAPIVRENDGLALSSRNAYLSLEERKTAPLLHNALKKAASRLADGCFLDETTRQIENQLTKAGFRLDYFELCDAQTLVPLERYDGKPARLLIAAFLGRTRLIDNVAVMG